MKRLLAILVTLSTLFALSACGSASQQGEQPSSVSSVPSAGDLSVPEGVPDPEQLPRSCRLYAQESAQAGAGEDFPNAPMSPYGMQGLGVSYSVRMADGSFRGLEWGAGMVHGNVPLREMLDEQVRYIHDGVCDYVVTRGRQPEDILETYDLIATAETPDGFWYDQVYLYRRKGLNESGTNLSKY